MRFPFTRTAHANGWIGAAQLLGHAVATGVSLAMLFALHGFDLQRIWNEDLAGKDILEESLMDLVLVNCIRTAAFIFLWTFTVGWHVTVLAVLGASLHLVAKCCVAQGLLMKGSGLALSVVTVLSILLDIAALRSFRLTDRDPDVELLQRSDSRSVATCEPYPHPPRFLSGGWGSLRWGAPA